MDDLIKAEFQSYREERILKNPLLRVGIGTVVLSLSSPPLSEKEAENASGFKSNYFSAKLKVEVNL